MAITEVNPPANPVIPWVRRLEAAGFRAWPAASVRYDGALLVRLNAGHAAKRLNSVNSLDPLDHQDIRRRLNVAERAFDAYGRPIVVRHTPLMTSKIPEFCQENGWVNFDHSLVMKAPLGEMDFSDVVDRVPMKDQVRFVESMIAVGAIHEDQRAGLSEIIHSIKSEKALFIIEKDGVPAACCICVREGNIVGLFEVATHPDKRRLGLGRQIVKTALQWAAHRGADWGWLQVVAENEAAVALYQSLGFETIYGYSYWQKPVIDG